MGIIWTFIADIIVFTLVIFLLFCHNLTPKCNMPANTGDNIPKSTGKIHELYYPFCM